MKVPAFLFWILVVSPITAHETPVGDAKQVEGDAHDHDGPEVDAAVNMLVQVQVEFIELPHENLSELLISHSPAKSRELREQVQKLVKAGTAKILETQVVTGRSGEKLSSGSAQEFIFPTEYQPGEMSGQPQGGGLGGQAPPPEPSATPFTPTSFETRNIGSSLEIEPTLSVDGNVIDMRIDPELTWHTGNSVFLDVKDQLGNIAKIQMPEIYTMKFHSAVTLRAGSILFTAALSPKDKAGLPDLSRKVMVFVKADVVP
ncbi:hypothetical protein [Haloferula sp. BvORR071]|uniref:hypothetical protein n=1 Tax=Haloferula sp. BvORR071 TaxID=1396141 RepID=UPI0005544ECF|nr:hypothetical protein [Haloferula sp. BvORR071]